MDNIGSNSQPSNRDNEDFIFTAPLGPAQLLVVGDFAESEFIGIDVTTINELEQLVKNPVLVEVANDSLPLCLAHLASTLNEQLVSYAVKSKAKFQCSVMFAATRGADLYYLPIGDCRIAIKRNKNLLLLNESVWVSANGNPLDILISTGQAVVKSSEDPPSQALGVTSVNFSHEQVKTWSLQQNDLILLYSDGVDKFVSPVRLLELLDESVAEESLQQLTDRILEEVRMQHGNDDRSVVIAAGPFLKEEERAVAQVREQMDALEAKLTQTQGRINSLDQRGISLESLVTNLQNTSQQILDRMATANQVRALTGTNAIAQGLGRIEQTVANVEGAISSIQTKLNLSTKGKSNKKKPIEEVTPTVEPEPAPVSPSPISEFTPDGSVREGLIHVSFGFYELVDERFAVDKEGKTTGTYLAPAPGGRPGWLTAFYLHLRLQTQQPPTDAETEQVKEWILEQTQAADKASELKPSELRALRNRHWSLRDQRKKTLLFRMSPEILIAEEKKLLQGEPPSPNLSEKPYTPRDIVRDGSSRLDKLSDAKILIPFILVAVVLVVALLYLMGTETNNPNPAPQPPAATSEPAKLDYGADGRTLVAVVGNKPQPLNYRILVGKEEAFQKQFPPQQYASFEKLKEKIVAEAADLIVDPNDALVVPDDRTTLLRVNEADVSGAGTGTEKCERFLRRVNPQLPVRNELQDLMQLNPNLRCKDLTSEHFLLVKAKAPPTTRRRR